jgi:hypothetical protein
MIQKEPKTKEPVQSQVRSWGRVLGSEVGILFDIADNSIYLRFLVSGFLFLVSGYPGHSPDAGSLTNLNK